LPPSTSSGPPAKTPPSVRYILASKLVNELVEAADD
jgi:hypothetical protein